jgi:hypothetical protein
VSSRSFSTAGRPTLSIFRRTRPNSCARKKHLDGTRTPADVQQAVTADVRRAAQLIDAGLRSVAAFR